MSTHKNIDKICCAVLAVVLILTVLFINGEKLGIEVSSASPAYETKLFDTSKVHTIDIYMDDWESFLETCTNEEYSPCSVVIDGETYKNIAIRAKGNTSLSSVKSYGNNRYSFKLEFDGYDSGKNYYGLDKLCLNNVIQDNTYMKDYLVYTMMNEAGAAAPLTSYAAVNVNGEYFGLYLAVEAIEDSFLERTYGNDTGNLYKPDSMSMGGGRGNGKDFDPAGFNAQNSADEGNAEQGAQTAHPEPPADMPTPPASGDTSDAAAPGGGNTPARPGGMGGGGDRGGRGMGSSDVSLIYSDDNFESYSNIFDSAKNDITDADRERLIASLKNLNENTDIENTVDVESVIKYFVVHNFAINFDSYTGSMIHNYYLHEKDGVLSMLPWDYNLAFGGFESRSDATSLVNYPIDTPVSGGTVDSRPMLAWIFKSEEYTEIYHRYFDEFITNYFDSGKFEAELDKVYELIAPYVESDPTKFCTYEEFETGIATLREFCLLRAESIRGQLDGSIPSTSDGQSANSASLIDAGELSVPAMGSMGNGGGMGGGDRGGRGDIPAMGESNTQSKDTKAPVMRAQAQSFSVTTLSTDTSAPSDMPSPPEMPENGAAPGGFPGRGMGGGMSQRPDMQFGENAPSSAQNQLSAANTTLSLLSLSVIVLIIGLIIAFAFKR